MNNQLKPHYHCVYKLTLHLVLITKYRRKCFTSAMLDRLKEIITDLCQKWEVGLLAFYGEPVLWTRGYCLLTTGVLLPTPSDNISKNKNAPIRALVLISSPEKQCFARKIIGGELRTIS